MRLLTEVLLVSIPSDFSEVMLLSRPIVQTQTGVEDELLVKIYRPFEGTMINCYCSYRVFFRDNIVAEGSGPGGDPVSALYSCLVQLAVALQEVLVDYQLSFVAHGFWWTRDILGLR